MFYYEQMFNTALSGITSAGLDEESGSPLFGPPNTS